MSTGSKDLVSGSLALAVDNHLSLIPSAVCSSAVPSTFAALKISQWPLLLVLLLLAEEAFLRKIKRNRRLHRKFPRLTAAAQMLLRRHSHHHLTAVPNFRICPRNMVWVDHQRRRQRRRLRVTLRRVRHRHPRLVDIGTLRLVL
jgi:hypothetical protein